MIDLDYGPGVFAFWIIVAAGVPCLYGAFVVDAHWKKHQADSSDDDVFN